MKRYVTATRKSQNGEILGLCNRSEYWSPRSKADAINDIELGLHEYYTSAPGVAEATVHVVPASAGKYLHSDPDGTKRNNLLSLPDC